MGGKARWRKLQRVVGCLPQGPHASVDKPRQRRERARTRDAKRRRLGEDGEENADTILIGSKKEIKKEDEEHKACENKNENDKEADKPHLEQEKELEDKIKTEINDTDNSSYSEKKVQEAMEQRAGVWTASPNGWVFRPLSDTTLEEELRKAQEEEDENGKRDRIHENGQRVAKFFLSDDESDSDTAIFIDAYQPVAPEDKDSQSSEAPVTSPCHSEALQRDGLLENSSGFLVQSQVQVPLEAEDVELVLADAIEEDEISETVDPLAKISTMEAVVTDCMRQDSQMAVLPSRFLEAETASDQTSTDLSIESAANSVNKQLPCLNKTDAATSSGSTEDRDCIKSESADGQVGVSTMKKEVEREADAAQDTFHQEADTESHSTPDIPTSKEQVQLAMITEATIENSSLPKPDSGKEVVDAHDTRGDNEAENLFFSLYPEYHPGEPEENDSRSPCDVAQDIEDSVDVASQKVNDQDGQEHPKDFQEICDASQTANLAQDSSSDDSPTSVVDPVATSTPEIVPRTILHKSDSFHRDLHQLESSASCQGGLEEAGAEAGQDALELESRLESERARQTLVGKAREWIKGVARMGATKRVDSSYGNQPILEATEDTCSHSVGETDDDNEVFTVPADTLDGNSTEVLAELESSEDVKVFDMPKEDQEACFTPDEDENDIPESGTNLSTQQIPQGNTGLQSSSTWDSWRCSPPDRGVLEDDARVQDAKESSTLDIHTKATAEVSEDLNFDEEGSHSTGEDWNATQQNITQLSPGVGDVIDHYPPEEKVHYSSPANEEQDYFTPGMDVEDNLKAIHDGNIYLQPPATQTLQACYPLPDPVVFPSAFEDSYDGPTPADYHTPYPKPIHDSGLHETPEEEVSTPYTPVEELKIICSSVELLQAQYTHEKGSAIHDLLAKRLQTHHTPEDESIIHDSPAKEQEAYNTPDNKDMEQNYTPANTETCYTFSEEYSSYHTPAEKQGTCIYIGGMNYDNTPTKGSTTYKPAEEKDGDYISKEEEEEAQLSHYTPAEEQENLNTPEREESVHHYARVEGEKFQHVSEEEEEEEKGYHTPAEEHWTHYTPADEQYTCCTPTDEINGFSTSAEDGEAIHTPVNEPNAYYETAEEDIIHCEPDEESFARDEEQESHNTPHITHSTDKEAGTESNVINEPTEANLLHSTSDNKLSTPAEGDEDAHTPSNDYNTPDTCAPDEGVTLDTRDTDLESHYIPDSHLETRQEEKEEEKEEEEEEEEKENEEKGENIAEKRVEDEDNKDEEGRDDYFEMNRERTESERGEKDSEGEEKNDSEKEERKNRGREGRKDSEREERADSKGEERGDSGGEGGKDSHREERKEGEGEERKNSERNERKDSDKERKDNENEGRKENERKERKDSEREEKEEDREKERKDNEKEGKKENRMKERKDSEREEKKEDTRKESKDSEREEKEEDRRKERKDSEKEEKEEDRRKERKDSDREEKKADRRKERKDSEKEEMVDIEREDNIEREEREVNVNERRRNSGEERRDVAEMEKRRPSDWEWRKNSGGEERRNSDWEKRRNERKRKESKEGKKQSETEGSTEEHTATQAASATGEAAGVLGAPVTSGAQSAAATLDSHTASEDVGASRLTVLSNPSEGVISDHTDVPQRGFRGGREKNNRELKSHQKHGKARHQHTSTDNGDAGGKASVGDEYAEDAKREDKSANKRRRNRRNKGKYHGEQETGITHPQSATGRDWTPSRNAEAKFFSHGGSWEMEVSHERDIHYQNKEYHSQRQESCSPRENFPRENSGTSAFFQKPTVPHQGDIVATSGSCKRSNKNVPYQKKQQQANYKDKFSECQRESYRRVERLSEEQKAEGAGEFAVPGSLGSPGSTGYQNSERRRNKGNEKGSRRCEYGEDILQEKFAPEGGESVEKPPLAKIWSPRIERKDKKDIRKERRERKVFDRYGEELKKGVSGTPGRGSASHSRPPLLETPVEGVTPSGAQKREVKPSSGSLLGSPPPPPPPSCTTTKLRYPEALSQPLSPPPSPPLNKAREMKEKTKPTSGEMEKIKEAYLTSDPPSYARKAASQSVMYTIPETAPVSPQQTEKGAPNPQSSKLSQDRPQCTPKSSSHKDTSEHQAPDQTKSPVSQDGKQTRGSSCKSPPPPSCHASHSPKQQSTSSTVDPQTSHEKLTSASHSSFPPLASPPPSQQESFRDFVGTPISKSPLKLKPEIDTSQKTDAAEEEISTGKPNAGSEKPPGSPGKLSVAQRMKFPELQISAIETKAEESHTDAVSRKTDVPQAR
ncbi:hypothetical protein E2C01_009245 [Portunus trituberculatus]|uniref:Uncharacterized protein n=1 Tax=Portunus trituberculatus TaxID=210409 RepID=A0A5B7D4Q8_PORTR|nr:hypothetical protein [Portunus trituberculatus]